LTDAPGLQILIDCQEFDWDTQALAGALRDAFKRLGEEKRKRVQTAPLLGLGVTVPCQGTGLPAVEWAKPVDTEDERGYPASAEICEKLRAVRPANDKLENKFHDLLESKHLEFPYDLDHMGRSEGDFSHIAIVHADGDGMSQLFREIGDRFEHATDNHQYIEQVRELSQRVKANGEEALRRVLAKLVDRLDGKIDKGYFIVHKESEDKREIAKIGLRQTKDNKKWWLPFRPIVWGGDDVTFVCDGRLGLALATEYLEQFTVANQSLGATACAGVAITKTHYPFARGYVLAEELCQSAKKYRAKQGLTSACMDWHFALSGLAGDIGEIRRREYTNREKSLIARPVQLANANALGTWKAVQEQIAIFQSDKWMSRRNKSKALRDALRQGPDAVARFTTVYLRGEALPDGAPYFDALELADWYVPLEKQS